jgi:hypothetical protein
MDWIYVRYRVSVCLFLGVIFLGQCKDTKFAEFIHLGYYADVPSHQSGGAKEACLPKRS